MHFCECYCIQVTTFLARSYVRMFYPVNLMPAYQMTVTTVATRMQRAIKVFFTVTLLRLNALKQSTKSQEYMLVSRAPVLELQKECRTST